MIRRIKTQWRRLVDASWRHKAMAFLRALFDIHFEQLITTQMLPAVYSLTIAGTAFGALYWGASGFEHSWITGVVRLFVAAPIAFMVIVVAVRSVLEFFLAVFQIAAHVDRMAEEMDHLTGDMEDIASLPRRMKSFWDFGRRKNHEDKGG